MTDDEIITRAMKLHELIVPIIKIEDSLSVVLTALQFMFCDIAVSTDVSLEQILNAITKQYNDLILQMEETDEIKH